jgi:hypothetical protein
LRRVTQALDPVIWFSPTVGDCDDDDPVAGDGVDNAKGKAGHEAAAGVL